VEIARPGAPIARLQFVLLQFVLRRCCELTVRNSGVALPMGDPATMTLAKSEMSGLSWREPSSAPAPEQRPDAKQEAS
jgi:hypothetical protein